MHTRKKTFSICWSNQGLGATSGGDISVNERVSVFYMCNETSSCL